MSTSPVPSGLPSLAAGAHDPGDGQACVMEYVSLLGGEDWSDRPDCTHPLLAHEARTVNDELDDRDRPLLVPLVGRLFGTTDPSPAVTARLRLRQARSATLLLEPSSRPRVTPLLERAERALADGHEEGREEALAFVRPLAGSLLGAEGLGRHDRVHRRTVRMSLVALSGDTDAVGLEAWPLAALAAAHAVAASGECRADCGDTASHARLRVRELAALLDEYDAATGRPTRRLTPDEFAALAELVG
ncbi:hypothetical protein [Lapillicoccus jejuensis]|uniref:Uncharacterized protein n=1 Tax=Lapillicoccus jejuensis TaxID=402171 RepID=A0A542DY40_9MICO|nr:hypothetical protein [Lapillicoccus jejuensis]TQJ07969.1 hypothetical protein FB458_1041 [Lapillicoccus jejuensis]